MGYIYTEKAGDFYLGMKTAIKIKTTEKQENWVQSIVYLTNKEA